MDELIDIVNKQGQTTGNTCLKSFAHKNGILHASVHIWFYTKNEQILIQKRKETKDVFPNLWDISVAGHIAAEEKPINAAVREIKEEINLIIDEKELNYLGVFEETHHHTNGIIDHEIHHIYIAKLNVDIMELSPQKEEVSALKLIDYEELEKGSKNDQVFVPHNHQYYSYILQQINKATQ